jgi:hypothetical protein
MCPLVILHKLQFFSIFHPQKISQKIEFFFQCKFDYLKKINEKIIIYKIIFKNPGSSRPPPLTDFPTHFYQCLQLLAATPQPNNQQTRSSSEPNISSLCTTNCHSVMMKEVNTLTRSLVHRGPQDCCPTICGLGCRNSNIPLFWIKESGATTNQPTTLYT